MPRSNFTKIQDKEIEKMYLLGKTSQQLAKKYGVYKQSVLNSLKRSGVKRRKDWLRPRGEKNGNWKGGIRMVKGYRHVFRPGHPLARGDGWVAEHRLLKEKQITHIKQVVHHRDGDRLNNKKSNLKIYKNNGAHRKEHAKSEPRDKHGKWITLKK